MLRVSCLALLLLCCGLVARAEEIVRNPNAPASWTFYVQPPAAGTLSAEQNGLKIDVTAASPNEPYRIEMYQDGKSPMSGKTYVLTFSAKASVPRSIMVAGQLQEKPWTALTDYKQTKLDQEWKPYSIELAVTESAPGKARFPTFQFAQSTGTVWIRDISLREKGEAGTGAPVSTSTSPQPAGSKELIPESSDVRSWKVDEQSGARAIISSDQNAMKVEIRGSGKRMESAELFVPGKTLVAGATYTMSFIMKAEPARKIGITVQNDQPPFSDLIEPQTIEIATGWQKYTVEFVAQKSSASHVRLPVFQVGGDPGLLFVREVSVTAPESPSR